MSGRRANPPPPGGYIAETLSRSNIAIILFALGVANAVRFSLAAFARWNLDDFSLHYTEALALRHGIDPYVTGLTPIARHLGLVLGVLTRAAETPFFLMIFEPLTMLSPYAAHAGWFALSVAALIAALALIFAEMPELSWAMRASLAGLALLYLPLSRDFMFSQSQSIMLFMFALAMRYLKRERSGAAGVVLGIATLLRGYPIALLGYLAVAKRWRALAAAIATIAAGGIATIAIAGIAPTLSFIAHDAGWLTQPAFVHQTLDISMTAFLTRLFYYWFTPELSGARFIVYRLAEIVAELAAIAIAVRVTMKRGEEHGPDFRCYSLWIATAILVSPVAWIHYMTLLILPFMLIARAAISGRASAGACWMAAINWAGAALAIWLYNRYRLGALPMWRIGAPFPLALMAEGSFFALLAGYAAVYWFAADNAITGADRG
ncbi:MAG: glycosyltransferase family 87 protein [Candidatus Binataceae bacterium]